MNKCNRNSIRRRETPTNSDVARVAMLDEYNHAIQLLMDTTRSATDKLISMPAWVAAMADFISAVALGIGGEEALSMIVFRLNGRIDDWKEGIFPDPYPPASSVGVADVARDVDGPSNGCGNKEERSRVA